MDEMGVRFRAIYVVTFSHFKFLFSLQILHFAIVRWLDENLAVAQQEQSPTHTNTQILNSTQLEQRENRI